MTVSPSPRVRPWGPRPGALRLVIVPAEGGPIHMGRLAAGAEGTDQTAGAMLAIIRDAARPRGLAPALGAACGSPLGVYDWVRRRVRFEPDPPGLELVRTPEAMLEPIISGADTTPGDCDDGTCLTCAMLTGLGLVPCVIVVSRYARDQASGRPPRYAHVLPGYLLDPRGGPAPRNVVPLDPQEGYPPGRMPAGRVTRIYAAAGSRSISVYTAAAGTQEDR